MKTYEHKIDEEQLELDFDEEEFDDNWTWEEEEAWREIERQHEENR